MTQQELQRLHDLFLSNDKNNWTLGAAIATQQDFEEVMTLEIERLKQLKDVETTIDTDAFLSEYEDVHFGTKTEAVAPMMLGGKLGLVTELCESWFKLHRIWITDKYNLQTYAACYYPKDDDLTFGGPKVKQDPYFNAMTVLGQSNGSGSDCVNEYLKEDFELEIEVVKKVWRKQFMELRK